MIFICTLCVLVKEKLAHDPDSEIATTCLRVSLTCPVSYNQIRCIIKWETNILQLIRTKNFIDVYKKFICNKIIF